jgi:hypothetical protein
MMEDGHPMKLLKPGHPYNSKVSLDVTKLPPGHPEGIFDSMGNIYRGVARAVKKEDFHPGEYPDLREGVRGVNFIEKTIESHKNGNVWVKLDN